MFKKKSPQNSPGGEVEYDLSRGKIKKYRRYCMVIYMK